MEHVCYTTLKLHVCLKYYWVSRDQDFQVDADVDLMTKVRNGINYGQIISRN